MIEPKPLSKEERVSAERFIEAGHPWTGLVEALLAAEQFWREAVKNVMEYHDGRTGQGACAFCGACEDANEKHTPDCSWLLAQD